MSPSVEPFNDARYMALMDGLECSEVLLSSIDLGDRFDAEYFSKEYLHVSKRLSFLKTEKLGALVKTVASAFYPAATQLYSVGDTAFVRCVDCIAHPIITKEQDSNFEKIPCDFAKQSKGISFLSNGDIVITKVGSPCYASIIEEYDEVALSRTVLGLTSIRLIDPYYLMIFLRCKYGFEQLYRQRELTIQYQLTLPRVKNIDVFVPSAKFQGAVKRLCSLYITALNDSKQIYAKAEQLLMSELGMIDFFPSTEAVSVKSLSASFLSNGRLDAEYYQPKYDEYESLIHRYKNGYALVSKKFMPVSDKCDRHQDAYWYVEIGDINIGTATATPNLINTIDLPDNAKILAQKGDILVSTVRPNRGAVAILEEDNLIVSGAFTVLRACSDYQGEVLQVLLRLPLYKNWILRYNVGTSYPVIKDEDVLNMPIPLFEDKIQKIITAKVRESFVLRKQSKQLLEYAKHAVEMAIELGEENAMQWLDNYL